MAKYLRNASLCCRSVYVPPIPRRRDAWLAEKSFFLPREPLTELDGAMPQTASSVGSVCYRLVNRSNAHYLVETAFDKEKSLVSLVGAINVYTLIDVFMGHPEGDHQL
jgi:hypothetical protein